MEEILMEEEVLVGMFFLNERPIIILFVSYPSSERGEPKLPYVCRGCSNHTYNQQ
jgi:hypothetical protein